MRRIPVSNPTRSFMKFTFPPALASLVAAAPLFSQTAPSTASADTEDVTQLAPIVVTATQSAIGISSAPAAVSVLNSKDIEARSSVRVIESLKNLPGVFIRDNGEPSAWTGQILMRGVAGYTRNAVLVDGQPLSNAFSGGTNWSIVPPEDVDRIEVVRGPFSSLYGGSAMGGVVNILTKKPIKREVVVKAGYGTDDLKKAFVSYSDRLTDKVGIRLDVGRDESNGHVTDKVVKTTSVGAGTAVTGLTATQTSQGVAAWIVGDKGPSAWWQQAANLAVAIDTDEQSTLTLGVRYHEHKLEPNSYRSYLSAGGSPVISGNVAVGGGKRVVLRESDFLSGPGGEEALRFSGIYEKRFAHGADLRLDGFHFRSDYWYVTPTSGVATGSGGTGKFVDIPSNRTGLNLRAGFDLGDRNHLVTGLSFSGDELNKTERTLANWRDPDGALVGSNTYEADGQSETYAIYLQDELKITESLVLYFGARYDYWTTKGNVEQFTAPAFAADYDRRGEGALSPKVSLVYKATETTTLRTSAGTAFRSPTLSDMYSTWVASTGAVTYASADLKPETIRSVEVGGEQRIGRQIKISGTVFQNNLSDMISSRSQPNPLNPAINDSVRVNIGEARIRGFETGLEYEIGMFHDVMFTAFANYTYTNTEVLKNDADPASVGKRLTLIPRDAASIGFQANAKRVYGYAAARYLGKLYGNSANLDTTDDVYGSYDPCWVVDTKFGWRFHKNLTASVNITNLFDRHYYQSSIAPGRRIFGELTLRF
jgi:iron complex outermembrane recepter protein